MTAGHECDNCRKFIIRVTTELCSECTGEFIRLKEKENKS